MLVAQDLAVIVDVHPQREFKKTHRIGWTMWDYAGDFGVVRGQPGVASSTQRSCRLWAWSRSRAPGPSARACQSSILGRDVRVDQVIV